MAPPQQPYLTEEKTRVQRASLRCQTTGSLYSGMCLILFVFVACILLYGHQYLAQVSVPWIYPAAKVLFSRQLAQEGMFTINSRGRLGNQMGQYATLYALAKMNGRPAFILPQTHNFLAPLFRISLPVLHNTTINQIPWNNYKLNDWMEEQYRHIPGQYVRLIDFPCSWTFYHHLRQEILHEFTLHDHLREEAQRLLRGLMVNGSQPSTFVGVHVRRGDYVYLMPKVWKGVVADRGYLQQALAWFRTHHSSPLFVVTSNDMAWCRDNIDASRGDVVFAGNGLEGSPGRDFALLMQCNHTIMTIGTFGFWAGYLTGGQTIYLANYTLPKSAFHKFFKYKAMFLPEWIGIPADLSPLLKH